MLGTGAGGHHAPGGRQGPEVVLGMSPGCHHALRGRYDSEVVRSTKCLAQPSTTVSGARGVNGETGQAE